MIGYSTFTCNRTDAGLLCWYEPNVVNKIVVSQELLRDEGFRVRVMPTLRHHWGLMELQETAFWPGDKVYSVGKPDAEKRVLILGGDRK